MDFNWGLIGPGRIAEKFARAMKAEGVGTLKAVASRNADRAHAFADHHQVEQAVAAIACGKHLLVEKPLTVTAADSDVLFAAARAKGVFVMEAMWSLFLPVYQQANAWLAQERIGEISGLRSSFGFVVPRKPHDRLLNPDLAGGVLLDMGIYTVATSQWFMQADPDNIISRVHIGPTGVDETVVPHERTLANQRIMDQVRRDAGLFQ